MEKCNFFSILIYFARKYSLLTLSIFSKKVVWTNTEISVEVGLFFLSLIHSFSFVYSNSK